MSDAKEPSPWRSLSHYEVLAADFETDGADWADVFPPEFAEPVPDFLMPELPQSGWRSVNVRAWGDRPSNRLFAAPKDGGWAVASVGIVPDGLPIFTSDIGTYQLRPHQESRRQGLRLTWRNPLRVAVSDLDTVTVTLTNTTDVAWTPDPEDHAFVHGHFLDENDQAPERCHFGYRRSQGEWENVSLAPGEALELPVGFGHDDPPEPGSYGIEAILVSLNLRSPKGTLAIVADPPPGAFPEPLPTEHRAPLLDRLAMLEAQQTALDNPQTVVELAIENESHADFLIATMEAFDINFAQTMAIGDMQVRNFFKDARSNLKRDVREVRRQLGEGPPSP